MLRNERPAFIRELKRIERKHRGTTDRLEESLGYIDSLAEGVPRQADPIPYLNGRPVYKLRIKADRTKGRDARLIFYYDGDLLVPLFIYTKADRETVAAAEIRDALAEMDLLDTPPP